MTQIRDTFGHLRKQVHRTCPLLANIVKCAWAASRSQDVGEKPGSSEPPSCSGEGGLLWSDWKERFEIMDEAEKLETADFSPSWRPRHEGWRPFPSPSPEFVFGN